MSPDLTTTQPATDRALPTDLVRRRRFKTALRLGALVLVPLALVLVGLRQVAPTVARDRLQLATADSGLVAGGFQASGRLIPRAERIVSAPVDARVLAVLVEPGDAVDAQTPLLELDLTTATLELARLEQHLAALDGAATRRALDAARDHDDLADRLVSARLDFELATTRHDRAVRLAAAGLDPAERTREAAVEAEKAGLAVASTERALATHAERTRSEAASHSAERDLVAREADQRRDLLDQAAMRAGSAGVVVRVDVEEGATATLGDALLRIADLGAYQVEASAPASVAPRLSPGLPARVELDAGVSLDGQVETVRPSVDQGSVHFTITLENPEHPDLRPNRRVDAWVVTEQRRDVVRLPARGLALAGRRAPLWVVEGNRAIRREVEVGLAGPDFVEIRSGLAPGDVVVVRGLDRDGAASVRLAD
jgi:HlyD family secretion protein